MDHLSKNKRSWNMSRIRSTNTKPEMIVRKVAHSLGFRYSLHRKDLPGKPDLVLKKHKTVIFVHGCFWHQHKNCKRANVPKSNFEYWEAKLNRNIERDKKNKRELKKLGWKIIIIWECETKNTEKLIKKISKIYYLMHSSSKSSKQPISLK
ncbi:MAG: DNA mismatch endonuclease Vsr [Candidatus Aureabacteria bacterium]|nr:DNA mismatch endonuclease Vsr [Candidatus Auribacterota bacterium]